MRIPIIVLSFLSIFILNSFTPAKITKHQDPPKKMKALIVEGQNNHFIWPKTTLMMKDYLEQTGMFEVDIIRTSYIWAGANYYAPEVDEAIIYFNNHYSEGRDKDSEILPDPKADPNFNPDFEQYDLIISNMGERSAQWPAETKKNFEKYMANGGGLVVVHAANNPWGDWEEFNKMIGLGAWGDRDINSGPYIYYDDNGSLQRDNSDGICASHGPQYEFALETRNAEHPIMKGLPKIWLHAKDELYDRMRGPGKNMTVLATAYSDVEKNGPPWNPKVKGTGRHEPMLMTVDYGKGKVFHTALGHWDYSMECVGFITTFQRGSEWVATGKVTQKVPQDFPTQDKGSARKWEQK